MAGELNIKVGANRDYLLKSINDTTAQFNASNAGKHAISIGIDTKQSSRALGQITGNVQDFDKALAASNARVIAFGASTAVLGGTIRTFRDLAQVTIEVEKNMADVNRVFGLTGAGLQKLTTDLIEVSRVTASSFQDSSKALLEFSRQGVPAAEAIKRTNDALTLTRLTGIDAASAVESLTATINGFAKANLNTTQVLNKLVAVEQQFSVGAGDLSEALSRTGQAAQEAGVDLDELNALVTAAQQNTARGGAVIGNALKSIFTRLQRSDTLDQLSAFNVAVRDAEGAVLPAVQILKNFASVYNDLAASQRSQLSEQVAGVYQINILKAIVADLNKENGVFNQSLVIGRDATNEAAQANIALNQTLSALFSRISSGTGQLANNIGKVTFDPLAKSAGAATEEILTTFNKVLEGDGVGSGFANGILKGIRNILGGPAALGVAFGLFKIIQTSGKYIAEIVPTLLNINSEAANRRNIEQSIFTILQQQGPVADTLLSLEGNRAAQAGFLAREVRATTLAYEQQLLVARQLAPLVAAEGVVFGKRGLVTNSSGFIPPSTIAAEQIGAYQGGYIPGKVVKSPVGGVMNTAEQVKYFAGFSQPFINPPRNSKAGRSHRTSAISKTGVDPYSFGGFLPTYAGGSSPSGGFSLVGSALSTSQGKSVSNTSVSNAINAYIDSIDLLTTNNLRLNPGIQKVLKQFELQKDSFDIVRTSAIEYANKQREAALIVAKLTKKNIDIDKDSSKRFQLKGSKPVFNAEEENARRSADITSFKIGANNAAKTAQEGLIRNISSQLKIDKLELNNQITKQNQIAKQEEAKSLSDRAKNAESRKEFQGPSSLGFRLRNKIDQQQNKEANQIFLDSFDLLKSKENSTLVGPSSLGFKLRNQIQEQKAKEKSILDAAKQIPISKQVAPVQGPSSIAFTLREQIQKQVEKEQAIVSSELIQRGFERQKRGGFGNINKPLPSGFFSRPEPPPPNGSRTATGAASGGANGGSALSRLGSGQTALALSFGAPIIAGLLEQAVFGNKNRIELSSGERFGKSALGFGATAVATGAGIGSVVGGPVGAAVGAGAGALLGLITAIDATSLTFEELVSQTAELKAKNDEILNAGKNYISLLEASSSISDPEKQKIAALNLADAFDNIKNVNLANAFKEAKGDVSKLTSELTKFELERRGVIKRSEQTSFITGLKDLDVKKIKELGFKVNEPVLDRAAVERARVAAVSGASAFASPKSFFTKESIKIDDERSQEAFNKQFSSLFSDLANISKESIDQISSELKSKDGLDKSAIENILKIKDKLSSEVADEVINQLVILYESGDIVSKELKNNFDSVLKQAIEKAKTKDSNIADTLKAINDFGLFRRQLTHQLFDELNEVNRASKTFEFDTSIYNQTQDKLKEVGDNLFSSILANASELGSFGVKQAQANFSASTQRNAINAKLSEATNRADFQKVEAAASLRSQINESLPTGLVQNDKTRGTIQEFLGRATSSKVDSSSTRDFAATILGGSPGAKVGDAQISELTLKIQALLEKFQEAVTEADRAAELKTQELSSSKLILDISSKVQNAQLDIERKKLSITLAQRDATNRLQLESETKRIGATTNLELAKIQAGGEFRTFGLNKRGDFATRQADQAQIFALEQGIDKNKAINDVRQSIIEIAAQDANTQAQDKNTEAILLLSNQLSQEFLKAATASGDVNGIGFANSSLEQNRLARESFISNKSLPSTTALNNFGINGNESIDEGIKKLQVLREKFKGTLTEGVINEEINKLTIAGETLKSGATIFEAKAKQAASDFERSSGFVNNMAIGFSELSKSADDIVDKLGRQVPASFADGIASALTKGITGAQKIGDALKDAAIGFGQQIISDLLKASLYKAIGASGIGAVFGQQSQRGGVIKAQNGMYISGGRTGDKNPALLEDGEYVLNRNAVRALGGKNALDTFNFERAPRFGGKYAAGGSFGTQAEINLIKKKGQEDAYDFTGALLSGSGSSQAINADNYSAFAYGNDQYFLKQREKAGQDLQASYQKKFARRQKNAALISTIVGAVGSLALSAGISQIGQAAALGKQVKSADGFGLAATTPEAQRALSTLSNRQLGEFVSRNTSAFQINGTALSSLTGTSNGFLGLSRIGNSASAFSKLGFSSAKGSGFSLFQQGVNSGAGILTNRRQNGGLIGLNSGGFLPHGSRLGDTIPAMLTGGEFVMNNNAVRKYGIGGMNQINNGLFKAGESGPTSVQNTHNNSTNISVNIDRNGNAIVGSNDNSYEKKDMAFSKDVARSIGAIVKKKMADEKRYGGELYKNTLRS